MGRRSQALIHVEHGRSRVYVGTFDIRVMSWEESIGASESMSASLFFEVRRRRVSMSHYGKAPVLSVGAKDT